MKPVLSMMILGFILVSCASAPTPTPVGLTTTQPASTLLSQPPIITATPWIQLTPTSTTLPSIRISPLVINKANQVQLLFEYQISWEIYSYYGLATVSPDGKWLALAAEYGPVHVVPIPWTSDHAIVPWIDPATSRTYSFQTKSLSFSSDSTHLAIASANDKVAVVDLQNPDSTLLLGPIERPSSAVFTSDGKKLIVGTERGTGGYLQLWNLETASLEKIISMDPSSGGVCSVAISPDGKILAAGHCSYVFDISTWDIDNGYAPITRLVGLDEVPYCNHCGIENRNIVLFNPSTGDVASGTNLFRIPIQNPLSGRLSTIISTPRRVDAGTMSVPTPVNGLAYTPDGAILAIAAGNELQLRDAKDSSLLWFDDKPWPGGAKTSAVVITPDSRLLISIDSNGIVEFWGIPEN